MRPSPTVPGTHGEWLRAFAERHGRPPAVLHIGNIGNNAYILSAALNAAGICSDVLCANEYHIMACPEWEDADFDGQVGDARVPDWDRVDLRGFARPRWFVQGPTTACLHYLIARRSGNSAASERRWQALERRRRRHCAAVRQSWRTAMPALLGRWSLRAERWSDRAVQYARHLLRRWLQGSHGPSHAERVQELIERFHAVFPERSDALTSQDFPLSAAMFDLWREALAGYDLVVGYSTDGIYPLLADRPYFAFEHGTIRSIPFEPTDQGRLCALTYRLALHAFITNADNQLAADRLGLPSYGFLPHPLNDQAVEQVQEASLRDELRSRMRTNFIVLHPARQHWTAERHPSWEKGNDLFIEGFARFVRDDCPTAAAVFVDWGQTVDASRALLAARGVADRVLWIEPQGNRRLLTYIAATEAVADQFYLGSFGGIMPKALRLGRPCLIALDEERHRWCFPEMPPVINVHTAEEVHAGLRRFYREPDYARSFAVDGPRWYRTYHGLSLVTDRFLYALRGALTI
jgi:hypothetical protein